MLPLQVDKKSLNPVPHRPILHRSWFYCAHARMCDLWGGGGAQGGRGARMVGAAHAPRATFERSFCTRADALMRALVSSISFFPMHSHTHTRTRCFRCCYAVVPVRARARVRACVFVCVLCSRTAEPNCEDAKDSFGALRCGFWLFCKFVHKICAQNLCTSCCSCCCCSITHTHKCQ